MINPSLGLRILPTSVNSGSCNTKTTNTVAVKPIMSSSIPLSNSLTILPNSGTDSLTIVAQSSCEAIKKRGDLDPKTPDILTIVLQIDEAKSGEAKKHAPIAQIMTASGTLSPSQTVKLVLINQPDKQSPALANKSPPGASHGSNPPNLKIPSPRMVKVSPTACSLPLRSSNALLRPRTLTSDAEDLDSEEENMVIDEQKETEEDAKDSMDPLTLCSVTLEEENSGRSKRNSYHLLLLLSEVFPHLLCLPFLIL